MTIVPYFMKKDFLTPIEDYLVEDFGAEGTPEREEFEREVDAFIDSMKNLDATKDATLYKDRNNY